jgi:hypothetical protein
VTSLSLKVSMKKDMGYEKKRKKRHAQRMMKKGRKKG